MPNNKITILSTGALDIALTAMAAENGLVIDTIPFISITPVIVEEEVGSLLDQNGVIVFTSANAVETVAAYVSDEEPRWSIYCIGFATSRAVEKYFPGSVVADVAENALLLADKMISRRVNTPVTFFCGNQRRDELPAKLKAAGLEVNEIIVYETQPTPKKLDRDFDGILFFSPSAAISFFSMNQVQPGTILFSIGGTTTAALAMYSDNKIVKAGKPEKADLVKKVIEYFKK
jgi:uroporphyrinogen-III synthase